MDVQAIYEAVRMHVGRSFRRDLGPMRATDMQRFAVAVGDDLPITMDAAVAAAAGLPDVAAPPLFLSSVMGWEAGPPELGLLADGVPPGGLADLPVGGLRLMGGGQYLEFSQPVVAGTRIAQETRIKDVRLKEGRSGYLIIIQVERSFFGEGQLLLRCVETFIGR
jgi:acyl dehydratase